MGTSFFQGIPRILGKPICTKPQVKPPTPGPGTNRRRSRHYMDHPSATEPTNAVRRHVTAVDGGSGKSGFPRIFLRILRILRKSSFAKSRIWSKIKFSLHVYREPRMVTEYHRPTPKTSFRKFGHYFLVILSCFNLNSRTQCRTQHQWSR